jgi:ABC-type glycerol-3-phosphate transport system substrate-binding protein
MKNSKLFQYVFLGVFVFFIIIGVILFSTYRSKNNTNTNINITVWGTLSAESFSSFTSKFFNENGLKYTVNYIEKSSNAFDADLAEAIASGYGPDAIVLPDDRILRHSSKILTIPFSSLPELQFKNSFIEEAELYLTKSGILALPLMVDPLVMYWNRDIFNNIGVTIPPKSWTEISALVPRITIKDQSQNIIRSTVALGEFRNVSNAKDILSALVIQSGGNIVGFGSDDEYKSVLKDNFGLSKSPAVLALEFFTNFSNPAKVNYSWNRSMPKSIDVFAGGDLALYFGRASEYLVIKNKNPNLNFSVALLPQIANAKTYHTLGNIYGLAIMRNSTNPAGSYTVLSALTSAQAYSFWADIFRIPSVRRDILNFPSDNAVMTVFNQSAIIAKGWLDPSERETDLIFQEMVEAYTTGREGIESSISSASDRIDNLLQ